MDYTTARRAWLRYCQAVELTATIHQLRHTRATELVPSMRGTAVALFAFSLFIGGGLGTWLAGLAIDRFGYTLAILGTAVLLAMYTFSAGVLTPSARVAGEAR